MKASSPQLKHQRVETEIRHLVRTLPFGAKLPAERDMALAYRCNFLTVRKALKRLVVDGTIIRRIGSGTFISKDHRIEIGSANERRPGVGVLVHQQSDAYAYRVLQGIAHASLEQQADSQSAWFNDLADEALKQVEQFKKNGCVAVILPWLPLPYPHERTAEIRSFIERSPLPVSVSTLIPGCEKNCFVEPSIFGVSTATENLCDYFRALGCRRISMIGPATPNDLILQKKLASYACYTSRENLSGSCSLIAPGVAAMDQLAERWKAHRGDLAIISYDDEHALRFMTAMHKIGLSAPEDYYIVGYNDTEASRYSDPPLSTIHQNYDYMGHWLLKSAMALAEGRVCRASTPPELHMLVRSTCGGRGKIDDTFRARFHDLKIIVEHGGSASSANGKPTLRMASTA